LRGEHALLKNFFAAACNVGGQGRRYGRRPGRLVGVVAQSDYMFQPEIPPPLRALSLFHCWMPFLLLWLVYRLGYDARAVHQTGGAVGATPRDLGNRAQGLLAQLTSLFRSSFRIDAA
jgi:hypothetical protein